MAILVKKKLMYSLSLTSVNIEGELKWKNFSGIAWKIMTELNRVFFSS